MRALLPAPPPPRPHQPHQPPDYPRTITPSVFTIWGAAILGYTPEHWAAGMHVMVLLWTLFYIITTYIEDKTKGG